MAKDMYYEQLRLKIGIMNMHGWKNVLWTSMFENK